MNLYASVRDENGNIIIIRDSGYKTKREFKETLSMNGFKIRFVCIDDEDVIDYEAEKYEYKLQKARENAKYKREWLKTNHTESSENAEPVAEVEPVENAENSEKVESTINTNNNISELTNSVIELDKLKKSALRIKINNLMCFTYLLTQAICKFLQNCNKVPNSTKGFIRYMKFNFLGIVFNIQVIDGKIIYVNFGRLSMIINNRCNYKAYDYVLDCYIYFTNIYYNIGRCIINAYRRIHINSYRKVTTQHILLKQFCGSYAENHS